MLSARRALAATRGLLHQNYSRKDWTTEASPCPGSLAALLKVIKERVHTSARDYAVRHHDPELVGPASPTPRETKRLSDLDDRDLARLHMSVALFYRGGDGGVDPAGVIRRALGAALVPYYPLAGRLRETEGRKLVVDCTGEGVVFVEADADVQLVELEAAGLTPPFPCWDKLLFDATEGLLGSPLLRIQVTRLLCGGFVFALRFNHTMCDGVGLAQFMTSLSELARGLPSPTVTPVWSRELIQARNPPTATPSSPRPELAVLPPPPPPPPPPPSDMVTRCFTFGSSHVAAIKKGLPSPLRDTATSFETLAAFLWRARAMALDVPPGHEAPLTIVVSFRGDAEMSVPAGYYGNAVVSSEVAADAAVLRHGSLADAVELVRRAKAAVTTEYVRSTVDEVVQQGRRWVVPANFFAVSDARHIGFHRLDFGWGEPVFAGPVDTTFGIFLLTAVKDGDGKDAVAVPVVLPPLAMDRFTAEVDKLS